MVLLSACLAVSAWDVIRVRDADATHAVSSVLIEQRPAPAPRAAAQAGHQAVRQKALAVTATSLAACEARIERQPSRLPTVAIVGASYTAGTGPNNPELSWAVDLARQLHWNAVVYGVPGAGYVRVSASGRGPVARMLSTERLHALDPALVIVQAGHDDLGTPTALERQRVTAAVDLIRTAAPGARVALMTTFADGSTTGSAALRALDQQIIAAGRAADPGVIVMDPLTGWVYPRASDGLHPTAAGDAWLAQQAAAILAADGVHPAPATSSTPIICDTVVGMGKPALS